jgi:hypothetical protein
VVNGVMYVLSTGCQARSIPKGLRAVVNGYFCPWNWYGTLKKILGSSSTLRLVKFLENCNHNALVFLNLASTRRMLRKAL